MPISENDIKLLASAALNDTAEGGGAMTGNIVVDGQDNNLFPDISAADWAYGRFQARYVYGVAHTNDTDTLLGAHAFIADAPDDPGVKVAIFQTSGWGDTRDAAKAAIEQYMLQGPKITPVVRDNHYAGSKTLQLYIAGTAIFPGAGDCILIQNPAPDPKEQYVRVVGVKMSVETVNDVQGSYSINIGTLTLADALEFDLLGLDLSRTLQSDAGKTKIYGTTQSSGTPFYSIKKLAADGTLGATSVNVADGIYTNLVPSSTVEVPLVDQYPLVNNSGLGASGMATISISQNVIFKASTKLTMPTAITPGSVNLSYYYGTYIFTDKDGNLMINSVAVGTVNYAAGTITLSESAPTYQSYESPMVCTYLPAASGSAAALSDYLTITQANVGLVFTRILRPAPLRGSLKISYMSLGKWYDLYDNSTGKIAGADSSYGVGSINYDTGSLSLTLGALPDIGSPIILQWCRKNAIAKFTPPSITDLPTKAGADIILPANINPSSIVLEWKSIRMDWGGGPITVSRRATVNDKNEVWMYDTDGPWMYPQVNSLVRCGQVVGSTLRLEPGNFPTTDIAMAYGIYTYGATAYTQDATTGTITLSTAPVQPGTVHLSLLPMLPSGGTDTLLDTTTALALYDNGAGVLFVTQPGSTTSIAAATVDYTTGIVTLTPTARVVLPATRVTTINESSWLGLINWDVKDTQLVKVDAFLKVVKTCIYSGSSAVANTTATVLKNTLTWSVRVPLPNAKIVESAVTYAMPLKASGAAFTMGDNLFTAYGALLRKGWDISTAQATVAQAGTVGADGLIVLSSLPDNGVNAIAWQNLPVESGDVTIKHAIFRTASAPLKEGIFDIRFTDPSADGLGSYTLDAQRGWAIVRNQVAFRPAEFSYAAVALSYLPLKASLLGLSTARLPLDGKVPVFHAGDLVVVHNTLSTQLVNPVAKNTPYNIGRQRIASVRVRDALGALVGSSLYTTDLDAGTITFATSADLNQFAQPFTVQHRIQDLSVCLDVDLSGKISLNRSLTHAYPQGSSYVSSCIYAGDLFARASNFFEQQAWTNAWANVVSGNATLAQFNSADYPLTMTNRGAITERWALIFTSTTQFRVIGEKVGQIGVGDINAICAPNNPATQAAYFSVDPLAWGLGWAAGNVVRFNTYACGTPIWIARTVLQGTPTLQSDSFTLAWRGDVNA